MSYKARAVWEESDLCEFLSPCIGNAIFKDDAIDFDWLSDKNKSLSG